MGRSVMPAAASPATEAAEPVLPANDEADTVRFVVPARDEPVVADNVISLELRKRAVAEDTIMAPRMILSIRWRCRSRRAVWWKPRIM